VRNELTEMIAWLDNELSVLREAEAYMDGSAQKRQEIQQWAREFATHLEFTIEMSPDTVSIHGLRPLEA
jgi:hypothetical protein